MFQHVTQLKELRKKLNQWTRATFKGPEDLADRVTGSVSQWILGDAVPTDGLHVAELTYRHCYLNESGDYELRATYVVENRGPYETGRLLPDSTSFFLAPDLALPDVVTLQYEHPAGHELRGTPHFEPSELAPMPEGKPVRSLGTVRWHPQVAPPIPGQGTLTYTCVIRSRRTEGDAFSDEGSYAGGAARWATRRIAVQCEAPDGYRFDPASIRQSTSSDSRALVPIPGLPSPQLDETGTVLKWVVEGRAVRVHVHYLLALRLVRRATGQA